jgi:arabinogalactan oligomer/maltooligosaccharide transport system permease protein
MSSPISARGILASRSRQKKLKLVLYSVISILAIAYALFPIVWVFSASLDPLGALATQRLIPRKASFANYRALLSDPANPFPLWLRNSLKVSTITSILAVSVTALGAYSFSRFRFRGRQSLLVCTLLVQVFPNMLAIVALFLIMQQIGNYVPAMGLNSHGGLILVYLGGVLGGNVWLMKGFFDSIPRDLDESAMIDGASHWQAFWHVILPLVRPILVVIGILTFIGTYGDVILARVLLKSAEQYTLAIGLWNFIEGWYTVKWGPFSAGALMGAIPILIIFYLVQDLIVSGLTQGAVKG